MPGFSRIRIVGHIGEAESRLNRNKEPYIRFTVAVNEPGEDLTTWYKCSLTGKFGQDREKLKWLRPGRLIHVEGKPRSQPYKKTDGTPAVDNWVLVDKFDLLDTKPKDVAV